MWRLRADLGLLGDQVLVDLAVEDEVTMSADVHDFALLHDHDCGCTLYRGQPVRNDDARPTCARTV